MLVVDPMHNTLTWLVWEHNHVMLPGHALFLVMEYVAGVQMSKKK